MTDNPRDPTEYCVFRADRNKTTTRCTVPMTDMACDALCNVKITRWRLWCCDVISWWPLYWPFDFWSLSVTRDANETLWSVVGDVPARTGHFFKTLCTSAQNVLQAYKEASQYHLVIIFTAWMSSLFCSMSSLGQTVVNVRHVARFSNISCHQLYFLLCTVW